MGKLQKQVLRLFLGEESPNPCPSNLAAVIVEDQPVGGAQKRIPVSSFPQDLHRECLPKDHVMPDYVYVLPGRSHFRVSKTLKGPEHHAIIMPLHLGKGGSSCPSPRPHQDTAVALGLQRVICGHKDGVGFGSLNLGHQFVMLGIEAGSKDEYGSPQS